VAPGLLKDGSEVLTHMFNRSSLPLALGLSLLAAACGSPPADPPGTTGPKPAASVASPAAVSASPVVTPTAAALPAASAAPPLERGSAITSDLQVKRFVVATAIENREPVLAGSLALGELPVFAFAELANRGSEAAQVVITFEREGSTQSVGHVELAVPGASQRWRTWGKSNLIDKAGKWSAVLRDQQGKELARAPFEVGALTSARDSRMAPGS
jgi:hypothetical protein